MKIIKFILLFSAYFATLSTMAQKHYDANIAIGGKAGMTLSQMSFSPTVPQSMLSGYMAGVTFRYIEEKHFGLIAELNVEQRGWKETFEGTSYAFQRRLTYIQIPLLTHIYFGSSHFHGFFNAGPELGYMISNQYSANFDINNFKDLSDFPMNNRNTDQFAMEINTKFDYGISIGAGMEFIPKKQNSFTLEGRFYYGLGNIFSSHKTDIFAASRGMSIMITIGYMYRLK